MKYNFPDSAWCPSYTIMGEIISLVPVVHWELMFIWLSTTTCNTSLLQIPKSSHAVDIACNTPS